MTATHWVLLALGTWLGIIAMVRVFAADSKDIDRRQSEIIAAARRARFVNPPSRRTQAGG
jgi:hypothetical protein